MYINSLYPYTLVIYKLLQYTVLIYQSIHSIPARLYRSKLAYFISCHESARQGLQTKKPPTIVGGFYYNSNKITS